MKTRKLLVRCVNSVNCMFTLHAIPNSLLTVIAEFRVCVLPLLFLLDQAQMHSKVKTSFIRWCRQIINNIWYSTTRVCAYFFALSVVWNRANWQVQKLKDSASNFLIKLKGVPPALFSPRLLFLDLMLLSLLLSVFVLNLFKLTLSFR